MEQSQFLVDVYTNSVPAEIYAGRVIQEVDLKSRQRLNIRYDLLNHRIIMKRYCPQLTVAKSFEQKMRFALPQHFPAFTACLAHLLA